MLVTDRNCLTGEYKLVVRLGIKDKITADEFAWMALDAGKFVGEVCRHNLSGWLQFHLRIMDKTLLENAFWKKVEKMSKILWYINEKQVKYQTVLIAQLIKIVESIGLKTVFMKGPVLRNLIYKDIPYVRPFSDIDILLNMDDALRLHKYLIDNALFRPDKRYLNNYESWRMAGINMSQHLIPLSNEYGTVEIHHRLHHAFMRTKPNTEDILKDSCVISTEVGDMRVPDRYDMFIMLCYHLYYHHCFENEPRLYLHVDLINYLKYIIDSDENWKENLRRCEERHNMFSVVSYCIIQTYVLFSDIGYENILPFAQLSNYINQTLLNEAEKIHSRFLLSEETYGVWHIPYTQRIFMDKQDLEKEIAYSIYHQLIIEKWEPELKKYGIYDIRPQEDGHYW